MTTNVKNCADGIERVFKGLVKGAGFTIHEVYTEPGLTAFQKKMIKRGF